MAANKDLDELLDGALDEFGDVSSATIDRPTDRDTKGSGSESCVGSPGSGIDSASTTSGSVLKFDPLGRAPSQRKDSGKVITGPYLPPQLKLQDTGCSGDKKAAQRQAGSRQHAQPRDRTDDGTAAATPDLAATLQALASQSVSDGASSAPHLRSTLRAAAEVTAASAPSGNLDAANGDDLINELAERLQTLGGDASDPDEMNSFVSGIMKQLLSKQVLHQSMKDIGSRYPQWLATHAASLSQEDLERYTQQHQHILDICRLYEEDPDNFTAIYEKLQQMQACGTPPDDIVQELSPGLQFDEEGLPKLPAGAMPPGCCIQ